MKKVLFCMCLIFAAVIVVLAFSKSDIHLNTAETTEYTYQNAEFPVITKAILYRDGTPEEIDVNDKRITKMTEYIISAVRELNYAYITGVLSAESIESKKDYYDTYMMLYLETGTSERFDRFDQALISGTEIIFIDSDSVSYLGEGNPFNESISPYRKNLENIPDILEKFF